jgi:3'(2'), 5'-bisphosphate nucleotidase
MQIDIEQINAIAVEAGKAILEIYNGAQADFQTTLKSDSSPLTIADRISNDIIVKALKEAYPLIPIISEEGKDIPYEDRKDWATFWCVDPLDGTKEFIKRNGEFTVNIALIQNGVPVLGVIYVPVQDVLYYASEADGSWKKSTDGTVTALKVTKPAGEWVSVGSRSHASEEDEKVLAGYPVTSSITVGSSLKFCMVAEGKAQIYYRHGPTMEWDTAAGHAIANYSGARVTQPNGEAFAYNKPSLLNGSFLCIVN